jgi:hypothetical protein
LEKLNRRLVTKVESEFFAEVDSRVHELISAMNHLEQLEKGSVNKRCAECVSRLVQVMGEVAGASKEYMEAGYYKERVLRRKVVKEYLPLVVSQVIS